MLIAGQMYMLWKYENFDKTSLSDNDFNKYLFTGWYIYNNINNNRCDISTVDDNTTTPPNSPNNSPTPPDEDVHI